MTLTELRKMIVKHSREMELAYDLCDETLTAEGMEDLRKVKAHYDRACDTFFNLFDHGVK
jgi:hypothetical protein